MSVGALIRNLRAAQGWSQGRLAAELMKAAPGYNVGREHISRWESGRVTPGAFWLKHLAAVLQTPLVALENEVKRRTFLTDVAGTSIAPLAASDLIKQGFAARLGSSVPDADQWDETLATYGRDYMSMGAADIQRRLSGDLLMIQQQLDTPHMWSAAARLMTLYAKTIPGTDGTRAVGWYRLAAQAADRSADEDTRVWVRGRAAIALGYEGASLDVADALADQALAISDRPSLGLLNAVMGKAHAAAIRGDTDTATAAAEQGERIFDRVGSHEQTSDYAVPHWRMNVFLSLLYARLGHEREALAAQDAAVTELPSSLPRFATHLEMHKGLMMSRAGSRSQGAAYAQAALDQLPPEKHSLTLRMLMDEVRA